jgi:hypothetical protein
VAHNAGAASLLTSLLMLNSPFHAQAFHVNVGHCPRQASGSSGTRRCIPSAAQARVVSLIVFTAVIGMFLATPALPPLSALVWGTLKLRWWRARCGD